MKVFSQAQVALIALLPKSGDRVTVADLARAASMTEWDVTEELREPWFDGYIDYDLQSDSFSAKRATDSTEERKST